MMSITNSYVYIGPSSNCVKDRNQTKKSNCLTFPSALNSVPNLEPIQVTLPAEEKETEMELDVPTVPALQTMSAGNRDSSDESDSSIEFISQKVVRLVKPSVPLRKTRIPNNNSEGRLNPPTGLKVDMVTAHTAELVWAATNPNLSYRTRYWPKGQPVLARECTSQKNSCRLEQLDPETTYSIIIMAVSEDGLQNSASSENIELTTAAKNARYPEMLKTWCQKISKQDEMPLYSIPLTDLSEPGTAVERFVFGKAGDKKKQHKTILLIGARNSGKSTLINAMFNYICNVEWEDNFRFQLIQKRASKMNRIAVYEIHHTEGFRIPYSLTIVNTPGYSGSCDLDADREITELIRKFVGAPDGIQQLDMIGFVAQSFLPHQLDLQTHIYKSLQSIFGKSVKDNVNLLITFADSQVPPILEFIAEAEMSFPTDCRTGQPVHHKFNNSGFLCSNRQSRNGGSSRAVDKFSSLYWHMGVDNFLNLFSVLDSIKSLSK